LRNYAWFLGLDGDVFVSRYDEIINGGGRRRGRGANRKDPVRNTVESSARATQTVPGVTPRAAASTNRAVPSYQDPPRRFPWGRVVLLGLFALVLLGGAAFFVYTFVLSDNLQPTATTQAEALEDAGDAIMIPLETGTPDPNAVDPTETRTAPTNLPNPNMVAPVASDGRVSLQVNIVARTWMRVTVDGVIQFEGIAAPGTDLPFQGTSISIRAANGMGVNVIVNNQDMGVLGARGEIVDRVFTATETAPPAIPMTPDGSGATPTPTTSTTSAQLPLNSAPQLTELPANSPTEAVLMSPSATFSFFLPNQTSTPAPGEVRPN
jgi:hypothetical protein